ncbi:MAG TPA: TonB-dependent receptor [Vicinamibacterales bacterium]|nr:TonB-dependent receptor [Vicinamibacterales bacterium]
MRLLVRIGTVLTVILFTATAAYAQASITGVARDSSGAVLPGVTVEAASPALIEKVRSVITDGTGQYRIVDLRPGVYTVTFSLAGFNTFKRDGIELEGSFVATVNADLRVGELTETITVSGESPLVDVQSVRTTQTIDNELFSSIPISRQYSGLTALVPALNIQGQDVGGTNLASFSVFQAHGGRRNEGQVQVDGMSIGWVGMGVSSYVPEVSIAQEVTFTLSGGLGEAPTGGPQMNIVPKQGGNALSGTFFTSYAGEGWQGTNLTDAHIAAGLRVASETLKLWDVNGALGGPIMRDRLWFYWTGRHQGTRQLVAGLWANNNAGNNARWTYDPDLSRQAKDDGTWKNSSIRFTYQATPRNKIAVWWDEQVNCQSCINSGASGGASATFAATALAPEADGKFYNPIRMGQLTWTSPVTTRLLLEAGFGLGPRAQFGDKERDDTDPNIIRVNEAAGIIPNLTYRGLTWARNWGEMYTYRGTVSYITGAHSLKVGARMQHTKAGFRSYYNNSRMHFNFTNGLPTQLTMFADHAADNDFVNDFTQFFAQDQWTAGRLTIQGGVRFEYISSFYPEAVIGQDVFVPQTLVFPAEDAGVGPKDINPRLGVAYDLFGNGKTAFKFSLGRYPTPTNAYETYGRLQQPAFRVATMTNRAWNDLTHPVGDPRRGNYAPDCDLLNMSANGECGAGNPNFGRPVFATTYDPDILNGWNIREYSWDLNTGVQHEIVPRVSAEIYYVRRSWGNQTVTDNRAYAASDYDRFALTAPSNSSLPDGGGYRVTGLYDLKASVPFGRVDNFVTLGRNYGNYSETYNGVDVNVNTRLSNGLQIQGGISTGRQDLEYCDVAAAVPEWLTVNNVRQPEAFCDMETPFLTQVKGLASYLIPRIDVQVAGTIQSRPFVGTNIPSIASQSLAANWLVNNAQIIPELGRPLAGGTQTASINIVEPGDLYGDRITQIDFRVAKVLRFGRTRTNLGLDLFNLFNASPVATYNQSYVQTGASWLQPSSIIGARIAKLSVQLDF